MNLQPVTGTPFSIRCQGCRRSFAGDETQVYADLDGTPWQAYYCALCAGEARAAQTKDARARERSTLIRNVYERLRETLGVRQSLREVARQTGLPYEEVCRILGFSSDWLNPGNDQP